MSSSKKILKRAQKRAFNRFKIKKNKDLKDIDIYTEIVYPFKDYNNLLDQIQSLNPHFSEIDYRQLLNEKVYIQPEWNWGFKYRIGLLSEFYVDVALSFLKEKGFIKGYLMTAKDSESDRKGIDVIITFVDNDYVWLPLQIKSSKFEQRKHIDKQREMNNNISSVVSTFEIKELISKIETIIKFKKQNEIVHT